MGGGKYQINAISMTILASLPKSAIIDEIYFSFVSMFFFVGLVITAIWKFTFFPQLVTFKSKIPHDPAESLFLRPAGGGFHSRFFLGMAGWGCWAAFQ